MQQEKEITTMPIERLARAEIRQLGEAVSPTEVRHLVDLYYQIQHDRIASANIARTQEGEPSLVAKWVWQQMRTAEDTIKKSLDDYTSTLVVGRWAKSIVGIGPVIAAGLLAHINIERSPTVGNIWSFAGLNPDMVWNKGAKRPYNAKLKVLCWKAGDSFVKFSNHPDDIYGHVYRERKALEVERNEAGQFAEQAAATLASRNIRDKALRETYESGRLPDARIHLRSLRYAVKLFLAHLHHVMWEDRFGTQPPKPYVIEHLKHVDFIGPPNWPMSE